MHTRSAAEPNADAFADGDSITESIAVTFTNGDGDTRSNTGAVWLTDDVHEWREYRDYR